MRCRNLHLWALGAIVAFTAALMFQGHPKVALGHASSASAPAVPTASFESAPVAQNVRPHFEGRGHAVRAANPSLALRIIPTVAKAHQAAGSAGPIYDPLHRRPPPSLS